MTMEDYAPPVPLWMVICAELEEEPAGVSITQLAHRVRDRSGGRFKRESSVGECLKRMREDGIVDAAVVATKATRFLEARIHRLTPDGLMLWRAAREVALLILNPENEA